MALSARSRVVVLLLLLLLPSAYAWAANPIAQVTLVSGTCEVVRATDGSVVPTRPYLDLFGGDIVRTKADGKLEMKFGEGALLRLAENTQVKLSQTEEKNTIVVLVGKLWGHIKRLFGRSKFEVETPAAVAGVRGTTLRVEVVGPEEASFAVDDGEIEVLAGQRTTRVGAEHEFLVGRGGPRLRRFDARRRRPWEFWTDALVTERLSLLKAEASKRLAEAKTCGQGVLILQEGLATDLGSAGRLYQRALRLRQEIAEVGQGLAALRREHQDLERNARRTPPAQLQRERARIAQEARALSTRGQAIARDLAIVNTLAKRGQDRERDRMQAIQGFSQQTARLLAEHIELHKQIRRLETVRRLDPHWEQFRPVHELCAGMEQDLARRLAEAQRQASEAERLPGRHRLGAGRRLIMLSKSLREAKQLLGANRQVWQRTEPALQAFAKSFGEPPPGGGRGGR